MRGYHPVRSKRIWGSTFQEKGIVFLATGGYTGYAPAVPGTFGTLVGIPLAWVLFRFPLGVATVILCFLIAVSCWIADRAEHIFGMKDPNDIVIDEIVGYLVTIWAIPIGWGSVVAAFVVFRILDILKPFPIRALERVIPGGTGVVMDDVMAGIYGCVILHLAFWWIG